MKRLFVILLGISTLCLLAWSSAAYSYTYTFSSLDFPGSYSTAAFGINNSGQIVGGYAEQPGIGHSFLLSGGTYSSFDPNGTPTSYAIGINDSGLIVSNHNSHGYLKNGSGYTDLYYANPTNANGINKLGHIVGGIR